LFVTNTAPKAPISGSIHGENYRIWDYIILPGEIHLYMAVYKNINSPGVDTPMTAMLSNVDQLIELQNDKTVQLYEAYLFSHDSLNDTMGWKLESLIEIQQGNIFSTDELATIFILKNKNRYISDMVDIEEGHIHNIKTIFSM